jgi:hypothetical protein
MMDIFYFTYHHYICLYHSGYFIKHLGAEWFWYALYRIEKTNFLGVRYDTGFVNLEKLFIVKIF